MAYKKLKYWFDQALAERLARNILEIYKDFPSDDFIKNTIDQIDPLELKARVEVFADNLFEAFHQDYLLGLEQLVQIIGPENDKETGMFTEYYWIMPIAKYVEKYGQDHFAESMMAIKEVTKRNTGEYAIRPFLLHKPKATLRQLRIWSKDTNFHVRRLASEGIRPRLPWAFKLNSFIEDPSPLLPILNNVKDDTSKYVQKSVGNCINDILKDNPDFGKEVINSWTSSDISSERKWIIKHALRNLIKVKDPWATDLIKTINKS